MFNSYSSYGEDAILSGIIDRVEWINQKSIGNLTYIDLGCFDPVEHSNTFFLYNKGWKGTLVDANPALKQKNIETRPEDIFLNTAVSTNKKEVYFFIFSDEGSSNTASQDFATKISNSQNSKVQNIIKVKSMTLDEIILFHIDNFKSIPFFIDIDIEGHDLEIIENYSWKTRIPIIMIEDEISEQYFNSKIKQVMIKNNYLPVASTILSTIYIDQNLDIFKNIKSLGYI